MKKTIIGLSAGLLLAASACNKNQPPPAPPPAPAAEPVDEPTPPEPEEAEADDGVDDAMDEAEDGDAEEPTAAAEADDEEVLDEPGGDSDEDPVE